MSNKTRVDMIIETLRDHKGEKLTAREVDKAKQKGGVQISAYQS